MSQRIDTLQTAGVNDVYEYNEIHLDSQQADNPQDGAFHPRFAITPPIPGVIGVKLLTAQIPFSWDIVTTDNNSFTVNATTVTLPTGNYTLNLLLDTLNGLTDDVFDANETDTTNPTLPVGGLHVHWDYNQRTGCLIATMTNNTIADALDVVMEKDASPWAIVGMVAPGSFRLLRNVPYEFPGQVNVTGANYLLLASNSIAGRVSKNIRINGQSTPHPLVLAKIPVTVNPGSVVLYTDSSPGYCFDVGMEQLQNIDLLLLSGDDLKPIVPKSPWSLSLMVLSQRETSVPRIRDVETRAGTAKRLRMS